MHSSAASLATLRAPPPARHPRPPVCTRLAPPALLLLQITILPTVFFPRLLIDHAHSTYSGGMDRYRIAPARSVCLSAAATGPGGAHLRPAALSSGRRSGGAEIGIFTAERYFSAADVVRRDAAPAPNPDHAELTLVSVPAVDAASLSGRTAASSEASWNSWPVLLSVARHSATAGSRRRPAPAPARLTGESRGGARRGSRSQ